MAKPKRKPDPAVSPTDPTCASDAAPRESALVEEIRGLLPVLPVLSSQLREVVRQVEESVVGVCGNFQAMAAKARQAVAQSPLSSQNTESAEASATGGIPMLVSSTRGTLGSLLQRIEQSSEFSQHTVDRMQTIERHIQSLLNTLREIDEVAKSARMLALNGQIEAVRAGTHGTAFSVVAKETANMAKHAVASSSSIREQIETVAADIENASVALRDRASADREEASRSREEVHQTLDTMAMLHQKMEQAMVESTRNTESLARDISGAVMALQFQDAVSQRIQHVSAALDDLAATLQRYTSGDEAGCPEESGRDWAAEIAKQYTMDSERAVLTAHVAGAASSEQTQDDNVELF